MTGLITLREFSETHGIKKPTVNARLKRLEKNNRDKILTVKTDNVIYLTEYGLSLLEKDFRDTPVKVPTKGKTKKRDNKSNNSGELIQLYQKQIERLEDDLKASRLENERLLNQIDKLTAMVADLTGALSGALTESQRLITDSQRLISQEQSLALIDKTDGQKKPREKKSFIARLAIAGRILKGEL